MTWVMVERTFESPVPFEEIQAIEDAGAWCLEAHDVKFIKTFFSSDRKRMLCLYTAPDAESVRLAERKAGVPFDRAWSCQPILRDVAASADVPASPVPVVVERELERIFSPEEVHEMIRAGTWCFDRHRTGYLESYLSQDGKRMVCLFEAPDLESVRLANRTLHLPVSRLWRTTIHRAPEAPG